MSRVNYRVREYLWVTAPIELETFCSRLSSESELPTFDFDAENVYEWGLTKIEKGCVEVNISRKHKNGESLFNEPIHVLLLVENTSPISYDSEWVTRNLVPVYGQTIANLTQQITYYGNVEYLGGDDFSYNPSRKFEPQT